MHVWRTAVHACRYPKKGIFILCNNHSTQTSQTRTASKVFCGQRTMAKRVPRPKEPRLLVVDGGDYAALRFKQKYDPDTMSAREIRELAETGGSDSDGERPDWCLKVVNVKGPPNRELFVATRNQTHDHDALKHSDVFYFEEPDTEEENQPTKKPRKVLEAAKESSESADSSGSSSSGSEDASKDVTDGSCVKAMTHASSCYLD